jgi:regulator of protease activity HflC (stomatin/prohibitin superfamily)
MVSDSGVRSQYGFDAEAVRNAITREVIMLGTSDNSKIRMEWNKLPSHLVVNIWREYIRKFKLGDLFTNSGTSGLQTIEKMINNRVKNAHIEALDDTGAKTGEWVESLEFKQLQSRGLEIMEVRIHNVLFEPSIEEQIIQQWSAEWMKIARQEENYLKEKEALIETASRDEGSKSFAKIAAKQFSGKPTAPQQNPFKTLQLLIQPLKEYILNESNANSAMEKELRKLDDIWKWLLDSSSDGNIAPRPPQGGNKP